MNPNFNTQGILSGYASFFNHIDHQGDRIAPGAFASTLATWRKLGKWPKMLWQHDPHQPIGIWTHLREDHQGLFGIGQLALGTTRADEAYILLKNGVLDSLSIGFRSLQSFPEKTSGTRTFLKVDLIEISLVTFGANSKATIRHIKTL